MTFPTEWKVIIHSCSKPPTSYNMLYLSYNPFIDRITHIFCDKPSAMGSMFQTTKLQSFYPLLPRVSDTPLHDIQVLSITESHATQAVTRANTGLKVRANYMDLFCSWVSGGAKMALINPIPYETPRLCLWFLGAVYNERWMGLICYHQ